MKRVLAVHGALEIDNFGDVLLGRIFCEWAREAGWHVAAPSAAPKVAQQLGDLVEVEYESADKVLYLGGGYFGEPPRTLVGKLRWGQRLMSLHIRPMAAARRRNIPYAVVGVGAGPITNFVARREVRKFLDQARQIAVRDEESASFLRTLRINKPVELTADAALSLYGAELSKQARESRSSLLGLAAGRRILVMHVAKPSSQDNEYLKIYNAIERITLPEDVMVVSISDQSGTSGAQEQDAAGDQLRSIWPSTIKIDYGGVESLIGVLAAARYIVTTKLHVGIVGTALQRDVLAFPAHTKTSRFYRQIGRPTQCLPVAHATAADMELALNRLLTSSCGDSDAVSAHAARAMENKAKLQDFLSE